MERNKREGPCALTITMERTITIANAGAKSERLDLGTKSPDIPPFTLGPCHGVRRGSLTGRKRPHSL